MLFRSYPYVSWAAFILCTASFLLVFFDTEQRFALGAEIVFIIVCYAAYYVQRWWRRTHPGEPEFMPPSDRAA